MTPSTGPTDAILIVAPHPDDETLGCGGLILRTRRSGGRVRVVFLTNGDGFPDATALQSGKTLGALTPDDFVEVARVRQEGAADATRALGLGLSDLVFLGYPDSGLAQVMAAKGDIPFTQPFTRRSSTYGPRVEDYHTRRYGLPSPYLARSSIADLADQIRDFRPTGIYITDPADSHSDHRAGFELTRAAIEAADSPEAVADMGRGVTLSAALFTYLVHTGDGNWPAPQGATPTLPFEAGVANGPPVPAGVRWPPDHRVPLSSEEIRLKHEAIRAYALEMQILGPYVESFVKSEEVFWDGSRLGRGSPPA